METKRREVGVTGGGVCCHRGDDLPGIEKALREGRSTPFQLWGPAVEYGARCQIIGIYPRALSPEELGVDKQQARFFIRISDQSLTDATLDGRFVGDTLDFEGTAQTRKGAISLSGRFSWPDGVMTGSLRLKGAQ